MSAPTLAAPRRIAGRDIALAPELAEFARQFAAAAAEAAELAGNLTPEQFNWRPGAHRWSIGECLGHLTLVGERCVRNLEDSLRSAVARDPREPACFRYGWLGKYIVTHTEPPSQHKYKAPRAFTPERGQSPDAVIVSFCRLQDELSGLLCRARATDAGRIKAAAPELRMLRFNLPVMFAWIGAHQRRHLWQARQVREHRGFPPAWEARG